MYGIFDAREVEALSVFAGGIELGVGQTIGVKLR